jgi:glycosyltransferase involved in cell wall biosynthesis
MNTHQAMTVPISVFIISYNEENRIAEVINSVKGWVDEIIVVDSESTDSTCDIARSLGCKVIINPWPGYGAQKRFAEHQCKHRWLFNLDADEVVSKKLQCQIKSLFVNDSTPASNGYWMDFVLQPRNKQSDFFLLPKTRCLRLYHVDYGRYRDSIVHDSVVMKEGATTDKLSGICYHHSFDSYYHTIEKLNDYSEAQAEDMFARGKTPAALRVFIEPFWTFFKAYILKRYCFLGLSGFAESYIHAFRRFLRLIKARQKSLQ